MWLNRVSKKVFVPSPIAKIAVLTGNPVVATTTPLDHSIPSATHALQSDHCAVVFHVAPPKINFTGAVTPEKGFTLHVCVPLNPRASTTPPRVCAFKLCPAAAIFTHASAPEKVVASRNSVAVLPVPPCATGRGSLTVVPHAPLAAVANPAPPGYTMLPAPHAPHVPLPSRQVLALAVPVPNSPAGIVPDVKSAFAASAASTYCFGAACSAEVGFPGSVIGNDIVSPSDSLNCAIAVAGIPVVVVAPPIARQFAPHV